MNLSVSEIYFSREQLERQFGGSRDETRSQILAQPLRRGWRTFLSILENFPQITSGCMIVRMQKRKRVVETCFASRGKWKSVRRDSVTLDVVRCCYLQFSSEEFREKRKYLLSKGFIIIKSWLDCGSIFMQFYVFANTTEIS